MHLCGQIYGVFHITAKHNLPQKDLNIKIKFLFSDSFFEIPSLRDFSRDLAPFLFISYNKRKLLLQIPNTFVFVGMSKKEHLEC